MSRRRSSRNTSAVVTAAVALLAAAVLAGCGTTVESYDGSAWPNTRPRVAMPDGGGPIGLVSENGSDTIAVVDLRGPETIGHYPVGLDPLANDGPHHLDVDPVGRAVFTALAYPPPLLSAGPHSGHGQSTLPGVVLRLSLDDMSLVRHQSVDANPGDIVLTPDRQRILVSHFNLTDLLPGGGVRDSRLYVLNAADLAVVARVTVCPAAHGVVIAPDGRTAYVACNVSDEIAIVGLDRPDFPVERVPVGPGAGGGGASPTYGPYALTLAPDGSAVYVSDREGRDVRTFDVATHRFDPARTAMLRAAPLFGAIGPDGTTLVVPTQGPDGMFVLRRDTLQTVSARSFTRDECFLPHAIARGPDGRYYVVCEGNHSALQPTGGGLLVVDPAATPPAVLGRAALGVYPDAIVFARGATP
jgi:DNA-binding beta-propeller fold protein YncE